MSRLPHPEPDPDGRGLVVVVNHAAGSRLGPDPADHLRRELPAARVVEVGADGDVQAALENAADEGCILGVAGGDGTISAGAAVAHRQDLPLAVFPAGTLNHLARDLGMETLDDAVAAVRDRSTSDVDLAEIDGRPFVNTASLGAYVDVVDRRERLERWLGKWPAFLVALVVVLRRASPVPIDIDGRVRSVWLLFAGNCRYESPGLAAARRSHLDDGVLDIRLVDGSRRWSRARVVVAALTGRLASTPVYERWEAGEVHVRSLGGPLRLAHDGETFEGSEHFVIRKRARPLRVLAPAHRA